MSSILQKMLLLAAKAGYRVEKIIRERQDKSSSEEHPLALLINKPNNTDILFNIPIDNIRSWGGRKVSSEYNPFVSVIEEYKKYGKVDYANSSLYRLKGFRTCNTASETLGVNSTYFDHLSPELAVFPWEVIDPKNRGNNQINTLKKELAQYLQNSTQSERLVEREIRGDAEIQRIIAIFNSVSRSGYNMNRKDFHHIEGELLIAEDNDWKVLIRQGEHRVAALKELGYTDIPILIRKQNIIRRSEARFWFQVLSDNISLENATKIFDNIMKGEHAAPLVNIIGYFI